MRAARRFVIVLHKVPVAEDVVDRRLPDAYHRVANRHGGVVRFASGQVPSEMVFLQLSSFCGGLWRDELRARPEYARLFV